MLFNRKHFPKSHARAEPRLRFEEYFNGPVRAWGIIQDYTGRVRRRFDIDMTGKWEGAIGTLEENFRYDDGGKQTRIWRLEITGEGKYKGMADDIIGEAAGTASGNAIHWTYRMDLDVGGRTRRITFDDRMFLMGDGVLINRTYLKKFGFTVGELTVLMQKPNVRA